MAAVLVHRITGQLMLEKEVTEKVTTLEDVHTGEIRKMPTKFVEDEYKFAWDTREE